MRESSLVLAILLFSCTNPSEKHRQKTGIKKVTPPEAVADPGNSQTTQQAFFVQQREAVPVKAPIPGKRANQSPLFRRGDKIRKGQLLAQLDNTDLFLELRAEKKSLREELIKIRSQVPAADSTVFTGFVAGMNPTGLLPQFPTLSLQSLQLLDSRKLLDTYDAIAAKEATMQQYFIFSPIDGRIGSVNAVSEFTKGSVIATIIPEDFTVSPPFRGKTGTKISLQDSNGKIFPAIIQKQSAKTTILSGELKPGKYCLADQ